MVSPCSANFTKWSITLEEFVGNLPTNCLSVFDYFVGLALKGLKSLLYHKSFHKNKEFFSSKMIFVPNGK